MTLVDGVFCLDARVILQTRDAVSGHAWVECDYGHLYHSRHYSDR